MADGDELSDFCDELTDLTGGITELPETTPIANVEPGDPEVSIAIGEIAAAADDLTQQ